MSVSRFDARDPDEPPSERKARAKALYESCGLNIAQAGIDQFVFASYKLDGAKVFEHRDEFHSSHLFVWLKSGRVVGGGYEFILEKGFRVLGVRGVFSLEEMDLTVKLLEPEVDLSYDTARYGEVLALGQKAGIFSNSWV